MKKVAIIGAGWMTKPLVDYLTDTCGYYVIMANRTLSKAEEVMAGRENGRAAPWSADQPETLDDIVAESDLAISMVPKPVHIHVARASPKIALSCPSLNKPTLRGPMSSEDKGSSIPKGLSDFIAIGLSNIPSCTLAQWSAPAGVTM